MPFLNSRSKNLGSTLACAILLMAIANYGYARKIRVVLESGDPNRAPFPSDRFTVPDPGQNTGRRINLPLPDCAEYPSDCADTVEINKLDGFSLNARLSVPFDGPIDPVTFNSVTVLIVPMGASASRRLIGIDQVVWNPDQNTAYARPASLLDQSSRYALIVTDGVRDAEGAPVRRSRRFNRTVVEDADLSEALAAAQRVGISRGTVVSLSVFTTQTITTFLERVRDQIKTAMPDRARFDLGRSGARTVFPLTEVTDLTFAQHIRTNPDAFNNVAVPLANPQGGVAMVAFGKYRSPDYLVRPGEFLPSLPTGTGIPAVQSTNDVYFNVYLPCGQKPARGWPVAIFGIPGASHKANANLVVGSLAARGFATVSINSVGHGFGEKGTYTITRNSGEQLTIPAGGRGVDQHGMA
jgi:hypothetical protein